MGSDLVEIKGLAKNGYPKEYSSGFVLNENGWVIMNYRAVKDCHDIKVRHQGLDYDVKGIVLVDIANDLMAFQVQDEQFKVKGMPLAEDRDTADAPRYALYRQDLGEPELFTTPEYGQEKRPSGTDVFLIRAPKHAGVPVFNAAGAVVGISGFYMKQGAVVVYYIPVWYIRALVNKIQGWSRGDERTKGMMAFDEGLTLLEGNDYKRASEVLAWAVSRNPKNAETHFQLGLSYRELADMRAIEALKTALLLDPAIEDGHYELGLAYKTLKIPREAEASFRMALDADAGDEDAVVELAELLFDRKEYAGLISALQPFRDHTRRADLLVFLGRARYELGDDLKAYHIFREATEYDPSCISAYVGIGFIAFRAENWQQGITLLKNAVVNNPENPKILFLLGTMYAAAGELGTAKEYKLQLDKLKEKAEIARDFKGEKYLSISAYASELSGKLYALGSKEAGERTFHFPSEMKKEIWQKMFDEAETK
jgi:tetratricopeptide (TPR) repeat protein